MTLTNHPGMMMLELSSYVDDVLSYYTDVQLRESILEQKKKKNIFAYHKRMDINQMYQRQQLFPCSN